MSQKDNLAIFYLPSSLKILPKSVYFMKIHQIWSSKYTYKFHQWTPILKFSNLWLLSSVVSVSYCHKTVAQQSTPHFGDLKQSFSFWGWGNWDLAGLDQWWLSSLSYLSFSRDVWFSSGIVLLMAVAESQKTESLLTSHLLTTYWSKQVTWPSPESRCRRTL